MQILNSPGLFCILSAYRRRKYGIANLNKNTRDALVHCARRDTEQQINCFAVRSSTLQSSLQLPPATSFDFSRRWWRVYDVLSLFLSLTWLYRKTNHSKVGLIVVIFRWDIVYSVLIRFQRLYREMYKFYSNINQSIAFSTLKLLVLI